MARFTSKGLREYERYIENIGKSTPEIIGKGVYAMADVITNSIRAEIDSMPSEADRKGLAAYQKKPKEQAPLTESQKKGLQEGLGIAKMQNDNGFLHVKVGFDGYNSIKTKKYPNGQPNAMIARALNSGTSFRPKTAFVDIAVRNARKQAVDKGIAAINAEIEKIKE